MSSSEPLLSNVRQLTDARTFSRAGEGYLDAAGRALVFQATPVGAPAATDYQIYVIDDIDSAASVAAPRMLSTGRGTCTCAFFHPLDADVVIFASSHDAPAEDVGVLAAAGSTASYQRSGASYKWTLTPWMNIYRTRRSTPGKLVPLTRGATYKAECAYSPCGRRIVYASNQTDASGAEAGDEMHLWTMELDEQNDDDDDDGPTITHRRLTRAGVRRRDGSDTAPYNGGPFFSPHDGGCSVVFRADYERRDLLQLYVLDVDADADTAEPRQLTHDADAGVVNWAPFWHPSGLAVVYTTSVHGHARYEVYLLVLATGERVRITDSPGFDGLPSFSADGRRLVWTSKRARDAASGVVSCQLHVADVCAALDERIAAGGSASFGYKAFARRVRQAASLDELMAAQLSDTVDVAAAELTVQNLLRYDDASCNVLATIEPGDGDDTDSPLAIRVPDGFAPFRIAHAGLRAVLCELAPHCIEIWGRIKREDKMARKVANYVDGPRDGKRHVFYLYDALAFQLIVADGAAADALLRRLDDACGRLLGAGCFWRKKHQETPRAVVRAGAALLEVQIDTKPLQLIFKLNKLVPKNDTRIDDVTGAACLGAPSYYDRIMSVYRGDTARIVDPAKLYTADRIAQTSDAALVARLAAELRDALVTQAHAELY